MRAHRSDRLLVALDEKDHQVVHADERRHDAAVTARNAQAVHELGGVFERNVAAKFLAPFLRGHWVDRLAVAATYHVKPDFEVDLAAHEGIFAVGVMRIAAEKLDIVTVVDEPVEQHVEDDRLKTVAAVETSTLGRSDFGARQSAGFFKPHVIRFFPHRYRVPPPEPPIKVDRSISPVATCAALPVHFRQPLSLNTSCEGCLKNIDPDQIRTPER